MIIWMIKDKQTPVTNELIVWSWWWQGVLLCIDKSQQGGIYHNCNKHNALIAEKGCT